MFGHISLNLCQFEFDYSTTHQEPYILRSGHWLYYIHSQLCIHEYFWYQEKEYSMPDSCHIPGGKVNPATASGRHIAACFGGPVCRAWLLPAYFIGETIGALLASLLFRIIVSSLYVSELNTFC